MQTVTVTAAGGAASIEFTGIPQTGTDLMLVISARGDRTDLAINTMGLQLNSDTGANYTTRSLRGDGSAASSINATTTYYRIGVSPQIPATSNTFGNTAVYLPNYTSSSSKSMSVDGVSENNNAFAVQDIAAGLWSGTSSITSLTVTNVGQSFVQYSTASLYTITKGSGGAVVG